MTALSDESVFQDYHLQIMSLIKSLVLEEDARVRILKETFERYAERNHKVLFTDENSLAIFLRLTARQFCINFLQATSKK